MKHRPKRGKDFPCELTVRLTLDVPAEALGLADGYQRAFGNDGKRKKKEKTGAKDGFWLTVRNAPEDGADGACDCEITARREAAEWEKISPADYYRYAEAAAAGYLRRIKEQLKVDLLPHICDVQIGTPLTDCLRRPGKAPEALLKHARKLFPERQELRVTEARRQGGVLTLTLQKTDGFTAARFRPGQYLLVPATDGTGAAEPFLLCSSPALTREGQYRAASLRPYDEEQAATRFPVGAALEASAPRGDFFYEGLRDRPSVIGVADRFGAAAFLAMAAALRDGLVRFKLTVLYLPQNGEDIPFASEWEQICRCCGRVRLVRLPAEDGGAALSAASLRTVLPHEAYSVFVCGAPALCEAAEKEIAGLKLPGRSVRVFSTDAPQRILLHQLYRE